jgi:DNA adenine methylase
MKPFIKWVGGKTQILNDTLSLFPTTIENYHEPFVGGGSVLLNVLSKNIVQDKIYASDTNYSLIQLYKHVQNNFEELYIELKKIYKNYENNIEEKEKEKYYYSMRQLFNTCDKNSIEHSALFMFLNKTCFRGLYREGPNGFNVPYGHYKKVNIIDKDELEKISELIKNVNFECLDFRESLKKVGSQDFVYLDPPYAPETKNSFVGYTKVGFKLEDHNELFKTIKENIPNFVMSNSNVELVNESFQGYDKKVIIAKRSINSKNPESKTEEVIVYQT